MLSFTDINHSLLQRSREYSQSKWWTELLITRMVIFYHKISRRVGGQSDWSMLSTNTWRLRHLGLSSMRMVQVWKRNNCGRWSHRQLVKVSRKYFALSSCLIVIKYNSSSWKFVIAWLAFQTDMRHFHNLLIAFNIEAECRFIKIETSLYDVQFYR